MMCQRIGRLPIGAIGLGMTSLTSRKRVPRPPHRIATFIYSFFVAAEVTRLMLNVQPATRFKLEPPYVGCYTALSDACYWFSMERSSLKSGGNEIKPAPSPIEYPSRRQVSRAQSG